MGHCGNYSSCYLLIIYLSQGLYSQQYTVIEQIFIDKQFIIIPNGSVTQKPVDGEGGKKIKSGWPVWVLEWRNMLNCLHLMRAHWECRLLQPECQALKAVIKTGPSTMEFSPETSYKSLYQTSFHLNLFMIQG